MVVNGVSTVVDRSAAPGHTYLYRVVAQLSSGQQLAFEPIEGTAGAAVTEFAVTKIAPNPTQGSARVDYTVARETRVRLTIVDLQGRLVATLHDGVKPAGRYQAVWNGENALGRAPVGMYFVRYQAAGKSAVKRLMLTR